MFRAEMAEVLAMHSATLDRYMRELFAADIIRKSGHGGRSAAVHLNENEVAAILLAVAAPQPGGAVEAVKILGRLIREHLPPGEMFDLMDPSNLRPHIPLTKIEKHRLGLLNSLASTIKNRAIEIFHGPIPVTMHSWELSLSLLPLKAWSSFYTDEGIEVREYFRDYDNEMPIIERSQYFFTGARRQFVITWSVIEKAALVVLDGLERTKSLPLLEQESVTSKTTKAGEAATSTDPRASSKQAAKPASAITEQPSDTHTKGQSRRGGLSSSSPSEKG